MRWASLAAGCQPSSQIEASWPGAKKVDWIYGSRSAGGSDRSPLLPTAMLSSGGYCFEAAAAITTPRTKAGWSVAVMRATQFPYAWPTSTAASP